MSRVTLPAVGHEALDSPHCDTDVAVATLRDIARANALLGGQAAVRAGLTSLLGPIATTRAITVLDVGAGMGDVAASLAHDCNHRALRWIALDWHAAATRLCRSRGLVTLRANVLALPLKERSVDVVVASQLLHHFSRETAVRLLAQFDRLARVGVVIADLERRWPAVWGIWMASYVLRFHRVSRRDGMVSVRRGFTPSELAGLLQRAGLDGSVQRRAGYRLVATWKKTDVHH